MDIFKQTPKLFSLNIEKIASEKKLNHLDAVLYYCEKQKVEVESVVRLCTKALKQKIEANAMELNLFNKDSLGHGKLPI